MDSIFNNLYAALIFTVPVIFFNTKIALLGLKNIDPTIDSRYLKSVSMPASIFEIIFLIWGITYLPSKIILPILIIPLIVMVLKYLKLEGIKFIMFVLVPLTENLIIIYSIKYFLE
ncbi:MAG: hypothetical protein CR982_03805 [Candidatus Cloacimonadota bacterium]|nr:MAG: hypothetical protein CR982_03805 [Candidatus Cloacimonadota bacterium]PIE78009.1 MAG: hypothetical protein CSA15_09940 [Candidatus Delongbacteria bacterium]